MSNEIVASLWAEKIWWETQSEFVGPNKNKNKYESSVHSSPSTNRNPNPNMKPKS